jgi:hypothetical protein
VAAEQFTLVDKDFRLPGLGSYLATAAMPRAATSAPRLSRHARAE